MNCPVGILLATLEWRIAFSRHRWVVDSTAWKYSPPIRSFPPQDLGSRLEVQCLSAPKKGHGVKSWHLRYPPNHPRAKCATYAYATMFPNVRPRLEERGRRVRHLHDFWVLDLDLHPSSLASPDTILKKWPHRFITPAEFSDPRR